MSGAATGSSPKPGSRRLSIFLSYRREDSADAAGRLYDALVARFGHGCVFLDIDSIDPGVNFAEVVAEALASCDAVLAMIGRQWLTVADAHGRRRLEDPDDLVRVELETALESNARVIPVLVQGVEMPTSDQLPEGLKALAHRNAVEMTHARWNYDLERLTAALQKLQQEPAPAVPPLRDEPAPLSPVAPLRTPRPRLPGTRGRILAVLGVTALAAGGVTAGLVLSATPNAGVPGTGTHSTDQRSATPIFSSPNTPSNQLKVAEKRSSVKGIPFTIEYPATWMVQVGGGDLASFGLPGPGGYYISYVDVDQWSIQQAQQQLSSEDEQVTQSFERHSDLNMTVFDWTNNGTASSGLNSNQGHERFYGFQYRGADWDIDCGWGTSGPVTSAQTTAAEQACVAAVNSIKPA